MLDYVKNSFWVSRVSVLCSVLLSASLFTACDAKESKTADGDAGVSDAEVLDGEISEVEGMLVNSGIAGDESLYYWNGVEAVLLAQSKEASLCHGAIFCDRPPTGTLSAFSFYDFHGPGHAFFVEVDHEDWSRTRIVSVALEDGDSVSRPGEP